jgi:glycosyltransferase involved in cell wall biosynthesis
VGASSDTPTFSIVIPTRGRASQLEGCLQAVARLDFPSERFEVVVVNDGGDPETDAVVGDWAGKAPLTTRATAAEGPSAARNAGIDTARGTFIAFTDDDCEPESGWLRALQQALDANPACAAGGRMVNGATGRGAAGSQVVLEAAYAHFNRDPGGPRFYATSNLAFPAEGLRELGGFDEALLHAEDRELCERWVRSGRAFVDVPEAIVRHMRELTLREFWRQHFGYGRGAWAIHRTRAERDQEHFRVEPGFYAELSRRVWDSSDGAGRPTLAALAVTSQAANAAGFAREAVATRFGRPRHAAMKEVSE